MTGAVAAASDCNVTALTSDLNDNAIAQHLDAVEDNASEKSINDNKLNDNALKMGADASDNALNDSGTTTVTDWANLQSAINDGAVIELSDNDIYYAESDEAQISISEPSKFNGAASLDVDNNAASDMQFNEGTSLAQLDLTPGKVYSARLTTDYAECAKDISMNVARLYVPETTATNSFKVMKNPNIQFDVQNITYNQTQTIKATVNGTGYVTIKLNGETIVDNIHVNRTVNCTIENLNAGNYSIELNYSCDEFTIPSVEFFNFTVFKANSSLDINDVVFDYRSTGSIKFSYENATAVRAEVVNHPSSVYVNGNEIYVSDLNAGNYTLSVTTITDNNHNNITKTANIRINKINSTISIQEIELNYGETRTVPVITRGANGFTAKINGKDIPVNKSTIQISGLNVTNNTLTVTTLPDDNHNSVTGTFNIVVNKVNSSIYGIDDIVLNYGRSTNITVGTQGSTGITAEISNGTVNVAGYKINVPVLDAGNYTLTVTTVADGNHNPVSKTVKITVNKVNSIINISNDISFNYGESTRIGVGHIGTSGISAIIDNRNIDVDGYYITISNLNAGNHTLTVTSIPDGNHIEVSQTVNVIVNKSPTFLNVTDIERSYGSTIIMEVGYKGATGIIAKINGEDISVNDNKITLSSLNAGKHLLTVTTIPDENHTAVTKTANITINKVNSSVSVKDIEVNYGSPIDITVKFDGASAITAKIGDKSIDVEGKTIHVPVLDAGKYTLTVTTIPDDNHNEVIRNASVKVSKIASEVKIHMPSSDYHVGDYFTIAISNNTAASVTINGKTYSIKDNLVEINTTAWGAGTYTVVAAIAENYNYNGSSYAVTFTVSKLPSPKILIYTEDSVAEGSDLNVNVVVGDATGIVSINGINHTLENGIASATFENVKAGDMTINAIYFGDAKYLNSSNSTKVNVYAKKESNLKAFAQDIRVGESATVYVEINPNVTGKVTIANIDVSIYQGRGNHTFNNLPAGTYSLVIGFSGDKFFKADNTTVSFNVVEVQTPGNDTNASTGNETGNNSTSGNATGNNNTNTTIVRMDPNLKVDVADVNVGEVVVVNVSINSNVTGKVVVTIRDVKKDLNIADGKGCLNIYNLTAGSYSVDVMFVGDDYFNASEKTVSFNVIESQNQTNGTNTSTGNATGDNSTSGNVTDNNNTNTTIVRMDPNLNVNVADVNVGEIVVVNVSINSNVTGKVIVTFNGNDNVVGISNGKGSHMILGLTAGSYSVDVRFVGDDYFNASEKSVSFNVIGSQNQTNGTNTSTGNATGDNSTSGNATGNNNTNTTIVKMDPNLKVNVADVNVGEVVVVNVSINIKVTGKVVVTIRDVKKDLNIVDGKGRLNIYNLTAGSYSVNVRFVGDDYFNASEKTLSFNVIRSQNQTNGTNTSTGNATGDNSTGINDTDNKTDGNITVEPQIVIPTLTNASDNLNITISLPDDAEGKVIVTVDEKDYVFEISNGTANVVLPKLADGNHQYTITYSGDSKYSGFTDKGSLNINNIGADGNSTAGSIIMIPSLDEPSESGSVVMKFPADAKGNVTLTVGGNDYVFDVSNGVANVKLPDLTDGDYNYTITYSGDDKYSSFTNNDVMKVNNTAVKPDNNTGGNNSNENTTVGPKIKAANANVVYASGKYYSVTVYGSDGKTVKNIKVTFKINGKIVKTVSVDSKGVAKFKVTQKPGTYKLSATALGKTVTKTLKVKHLVTLKTVKVKKSTKKLVLQATLGKINGKYLKNKKITFKFKGKKYTAKTNKKGVAKVTIKKSVLMKLKVGKKVTYQATYLKDTVKKTAKIKK